MEFWTSWKLPWYIKIYFKNWEQTEVCVPVTACESDCTPAFPTQCRWSHGVCTRGYSRTALQRLRNTSMLLFCADPALEICLALTIFFRIFFQWNVFCLLAQCWQCCLCLCSAMSWFQQEEKAPQKLAATNSSVMEWQVWEPSPFGLSSTEHQSQLSLCYFL